MFSGSFAWYDVSGVGKLVIAIAFTVGALAGWRWRLSTRRAWALVVCAGVDAGAVAHILTLVVLARDPDRNITGVPLAEPLDEIAISFAMRLIIAGPALLGVAVSGFWQARGARPRDWIAYAAFAGSLYLAWLGPWALAVLLD